MAKNHIEIEKRLCFSFPTFLQHVLLTLKFRANLQFACVKLVLKLVYQNQAIQGKVPTLSLRLTAFWPTFCESLAICYLLA